MTVSLAEAKAHCRVDFSDEDQLVAVYIAAASDHLSSIGVDMTADPLPGAVKQAQLLLIGHFYDGRNATAPDDYKLIELGVDRLIAPYRETEL